MPLLFLRYIKRSCALVFTLSCCASLVNAGSLVKDNGEETILIEKTMTFSPSYHQALKSVTQRIFKFDIDSFLSGGKNVRSAIIRNFSEFADRTKYGVEIKPNKVNLKFSLNF